MSARPTQGPWSYGLAAAIGVACAYALAAWLDCSTAEGVALCLAPAALPSPWQRLLRGWLLWRLRRAERRVRRCKHRQLRCAADHMNAEDAVLHCRRHLQDAGIHPGGLRHGR